jgi:hypothetical protein
MRAESNYIPLKEAAKHFPGRPHLSTIIRWSDAGVHGVILKSIRVGRRIFTTKEAIDEFLAELNKTDAERLEEEGA